MISLTSTAQGVAPGARQGRSRALRAYQASTGSAKDVDMMLPRVTSPYRPAGLPARASGPRNATGHGKPARYGSAPRTAESA